MSISAPRYTLPLLALTLALFACTTTDSRVRQDQPAADIDDAAEKTMLVQFLEIVTPDVEATCATLERLHGVSFGEPVAEFGNARTAALETGGRVSVRAPMAEHEKPLVRPYVLVDDIESAVTAAEAAGAEIAIAPTEIPGHGKFAIYILGGIQHGLWQL